GEHEVPVLALTPTGYAALGIDPPAGDEQDKAEQHPEDEVPLPLPERFRRTYEAELGEIHGDSDSAPYRRVWDHVMNDRPTAPRWLLGHLADVAALLVDLVYEAQETTPATRADCRRGCVELL
ncbi:hypothetical protein, partial [Streptomyces sp. GSL17-113]|uniref:hypothetical protein n=1 Tax=Streptomyces sp. GSL17-113 TaxID=3115365 RepID=UPI002E7676D3